MPDKDYIDPVEDPRGAEKSSKQLNTGGKATDEPNDSNTASKAETPGAGTEVRTGSSEGDEDSPKADGNATRQPGPKGEPNKPGEETAPIDKSSSPS